MCIRDSITLNLIDEMSPGVLKIGDEFLYVLIDVYKRQEPYMIPLYFPVAIAWSR